MYDKKFIKSLTIVGIISLLCLSFFFEYNSINLLDENKPFYNSELSKRKLKISLPYSPIHINNNWSDAKAAGICNGSGVINDPYVIADLTIDGGGSKNCILIGNSSDYFTIRNCIVYNSQYGMDYAGIKLHNTNNGLLINNTCFDNAHGIFLQEGCNNNNISRNKIHDNLNRGIYISEYTAWSSNNIILNNTISNNDATGIVLDGNWDFDGVNNDIINNTIMNNEGYGILCEGGYNDISGNTIINSKYNGMRLLGEDCVYNSIINNTIVNCEVAIIFSGTHITVTNNKMENCGLYSISLSNDPGTSYIIDNSNTVNGKPLYFYEDESNLEFANFTNAGQIFLLNCSDSVISNLNFINITLGILLSYCNNCSISETNISDNSYSGIRLTYSNNISISECWLSKNNKGIMFLEGNDNNISNNDITHNAYAGIHLYNNKKTKIYGNNINNGREGILFEDCDLNIISNNTINNNGNTGVSLTFLSNDNIISNNTINYNDIGIYLSRSDDNSIINNTLLGNIQCIVEYQCTNNIQDNQCGFSPIITILSPKNDEVFGEEAPTFEIEINAVDLTDYWYRIEGYVGVIHFPNLVGSIDQLIWDDLPEGEILITFYAKDISENIGNNSVIVIKRIPSQQPQIPGYNVIMLIGVNSLVLIVIIKKWKNFQKKNSMKI